MAVSLQPGLFNLVQRDVVLRPAAENGVTGSMAHLRLSTASEAKCRGRDRVCQQAPEESLSWGSTGSDELSHQLRGSCLGSGTRSVGRRSSKAAAVRASANGALYAAPADNGAANGAFRAGAKSLSKENGALAARKSEDNNSNRPLFPEKELPSTSAAKSQVVAETLVALASNGVAAPLPSVAPSSALTAIEAALEDVKKGKLIVLIDSSKPDAAAQFYQAGAMASEEGCAFMVNYGSGLIFSPAAPSLLDRLKLPLMVEEDDFTGMPPRPFTVTIDLVEGTTTGISAADRALTIRHLADGQAKPDDFRRPGHVIPVRANKGGVLEEAGYPEAAVDLATLAGFSPVGVLCAVTNADGSMGKLADAQLLARQHGLQLVSLPDLLTYKKMSERLVERAAVARLPTKFGTFQIYSYLSTSDGIEHVAIVKGDVAGEDVLCRVHSECLTGDIFGSDRCDCGPQLEQALQRIEQAGRGVVVYMRGHEGRGIGLSAKLKAYILQDQGRDTVEGNTDQGLPVDSREYGASAQILKDLGVLSVRLMTNNPAKFQALTSFGIVVNKRVPVLCPITPENKRYLDTKRKKMGHLYTAELIGGFAGLPVEMPEALSPGADGEASRW
eukprot:TRINITY_DN19304_c0_g1_i1.p1 TRINITY_DN19304_c0_g1~~TRINITY_DN19304_c0_g1_i1.p1  ORF type:complete len:614 (-),score=115.56 TRINITY_DN19304_c0_g1_i1:1195-3036(-)